jgi:bifunctional non-homologous end joining protein LigD
MPDPTAVHHEAFPSTLRPMLASTGPLPRGERWIFELKWDGVRALVGQQREGGLRIWTRNGNVVTGTYPELAPLGEALRDHDVVLDGEVVAFDAQGRPSFHRLQERLGVSDRDALLRARTNPVVFVVFDLLHLDGMSTRSLAWSQRRSLLEQLDLGSAASWNLSTVHTDGEALHDATRRADLEGVVAKRVDAPYSAGTRSSGWIKIKNNTIDEFVIGGWVPGDGRRESMIGALLLGVPVDESPLAPLRWIGKAGTGFTMAELERLHRLLSPERTVASPFVNDPGEPTAVFVSPRHRCRVEYREWTAEGIMRFPSYKGLVADGTVSDPSLTEEET